MAPHFDDFFEANNERISEVVTYHLNIEALLEHMLRQKLVEPTVLDFERMMFAQKASLACALGLIDKPLFDVLKKMNTLRNKFAHRLKFSPTLEEVHLIAVDAGKAGVDFSDGIDSRHIDYVKSLNYDVAGLLNSLFRNVFFEMAWRMGDDFAAEFLS